MLTDDERKTLLTCDGRGKEAKAAILAKLETENAELRDVGAKAKAFAKAYDADRLSADHRLGDAQNAAMSELLVAARKL